MNGVYKELVCVCVCEGEEENASADNALNENNEGNGGNIRYGGIKQTRE